MYYSGKEDGVPEEWVKRMKQCLMNISPAFNCQRMVGEYMEKLYEPAHSEWSEIRTDNFQLARQRTAWSNKVNLKWNSVKFVELGTGPDASIVSGSPLPLRTVIDLAGLDPTDVCVEAVLGRVGPTGQLEDTEVLQLPATEQRGTSWVFERVFVPHQTGLLGYGLRVSPNHTDNPLTRPCNSLIKWGLE